MCACTLPPHCAPSHDPCDLFAMRRVSQTGKAEHGACPRGRLGAPALQGVSLCCGVRLAVQRLLVASACWLVRVGTPAHSLSGRSSAAAWRAMLWDENCDEDAFDAFPDSDDEVLFCFHRPSRVPVIACSRFLRNSFSSQALWKQSSLKGAEQSASVVFFYWLIHLQCFHLGGMDARDPVAHAGGGGGGTSRRAGATSANANAITML